MPGRIDPSLVAGPLAALAALAPDTADATCGDSYYGPCNYADGWGSLAPRNAAAIPTDGVLVLQGELYGSTEDAIAALDLTITRDGQPIAGALEPTPIYGVLVWRPAEPWQPGATYQLTGTTLPDATGCAQEITLDTDLHIDTEPGEPLRPSELTAETTLEISGDLDLETLACCADAPSPERHLNGNYLCMYDTLDFDEEQCTPTTGYGYFTLTVTGTPAADGPVAGQVFYTFRRDGEVFYDTLTPEATLYGESPTCVAFDATDLATGAVVRGDERCFGDDLVDQLGPQQLDPAESLTCPEIQQCTIVDDAWDKSDCQPFGDPPDPEADPDSDQGCGCTTSTPDPALLTLGLFTLPRRRKPR